MAISSYGYRLPMRKALLLFNTIRYLKFFQVVYRLYYYFFTPRVETQLSSSLRSAGAFWKAPSHCNISTNDGEFFTFFGETAKIDSDWNVTERSKLWIYNLHYQDCLNASVDGKVDVELSRRLIDKWISSNPPVLGNGWEPYCISLRVVNWVKFLLHEENPDIKQLWLDSFCFQVEFLSRRVEYHIQANHLFANAKALVFAGAFLSGQKGDIWLHKGLRILDGEIEEQFLADGAHYERSPMYHAALLWDLADLIYLAKIYELSSLTSRVALWQHKLRLGLSWLESMMHPDGDISFFNDAALNIAPDYFKLLGYSSLLGVEVDSNPIFDNLRCDFLRDSGYIAISLPGARHKLIADLAAIGPDYQPGHAHADTLSFELSLFGCRVFVNSGTSQYGEDLERHRQRSTSAHNTVEVDGENSSEVWAGFRVARRAYPVVEEIITSDEEIFVRAYHTGYRRLKGKNLHRREWAFKKDSCLIIDEVTGFFNSAIARLHVHPDVFFSWDENALVAVLKNGNKLRVVIEGASSVTLQQSTWHPAFGVVIPCQCIVAEFSSGKLMTNIKWSGHV